MKLSTPTKNGVVYDIDNSPYETLRSGLLFRFSSLRHKEKFDSQIRMKEEWLNDSLSRRFHVKINVNVLAAIQLYIQIESRGFYIYDVVNEEEYTCQNHVVLNGLKMHEQDSQEQYENTMML